MSERATLGERFASSKFAEKRVGRGIVDLFIRERDVLAGRGVISVSEIKSHIIFGKYKILEGEFTVNLTNEKIRTPRTSIFRFTSRTSRSRRAQG